MRIFFTNLLINLIMLISIFLPIWSGNEIKVSNGSHTCLMSPRSSFKLAHNPWPPAMLPLLVTIFLWTLASFWARILLNVPSKESFSQHLEIKKNGETGSVLLQENSNNEARNNRFDQRSTVLYHLTLLLEHISIYRKVYCMLHKV